MGLCSFLIGPSALRVSSKMTSSSYRRLNGQPMRKRKKRERIKRKKKKRRRRRKRGRARGPTGTPVADVLGLELLHADAVRLPVKNTENDVAVPTTTTRRATSKSQGLRAQLFPSVFLNALTAPSSNVRRRQRLQTDVLPVSLLCRSSRFGPGTTESTCVLLGAPRSVSVAVARLKNGHPRLTVPLGQKGPNAASTVWRRLFKNGRPLETQLEHRGRTMLDASENAKSIGSSGSSTTCRQKMPMFSSSTNE